MNVRRVSAAVRLQTKGFCMGFDEPVAGMFVLCPARHHLAALPCGLFQHSPFCLVQICFLQFCRMFFCVLTLTLMPILLLLWFLISLRLTCQFGACYTWILVLFASLRGSCWTDLYSCERWLFLMWIWSGNTALVLDCAVIIIVLAFLCHRHRHRTDMQVYWIVYFEQLLTCLAV